MTKTLDSEIVFQGGIFHIRHDKIAEADAVYFRDVVVHNGSAVIVPFFSDGTIALVRQYRHATGKYLLELPAGSLEPNEDPLVGARRELEEEVGVTAGKFEKLTEFYVSPGFLTEKMFVFLATELTETAQDLDQDEFIEIERYSFEDLNNMIASGEIEEAKTMLGIIFAQKALNLAETNGI